jgi:nitrous oxidase accessory protein NosD
VSNNASFTMTGGEISGNIISSLSNGAGVAVGGTFTMSGGTISGNITAANGGGVWVTNNASFTMTGGTISGNTASSSGGRGGGVYVFSGSSTKTGGTISGYGSDTVNGNVVKNSSGVVQSNQGHAVYASAGSNPIVTKRKETTAGPGNNLLFNSTNPATFSGAWDY